MTLRFEIIKLNGKAFYEKHYAWQVLRLETANWFRVGEAQAWTRNGAIHQARRKVNRLKNVESESEIIYKEDG